MLLLIDNYDSFTYNLVHFLGELGADTVVRRNDALTPKEAVVRQRELAGRVTVHEEAIPSSTPSR